MSYDVTFVWKSFELTCPWTFMLYVDHYPFFISVFSSETTGIKQFVWNMIKASVLNQLVIWTDILLETIFSTLHCDGKEPLLISIIDIYHGVDWNLYQLNLDIQLILMISYMYLESYGYVHISVQCISTPGELYKVLTIF